MTAPHLGIYAHHVGSGHLTRAGAIAAAWDGRVTILTSATPDRLADGIDFVRLPREHEDGPGVRTPEVLHHAPLGDRGLQQRMATIVAWIRATAPDVVLVDVSVEVALLMRLHGVPTAVVRHPGRRDDRPHRLCWAAADLVLAPWGEPGVRDAVEHVGLLSRFDTHRRRIGPIGDDHVDVVVVVGTAGTELRPRHLRRLIGGLPTGHRVRIIGTVPADGTGDARLRGSWVHDPWPVLVGADVVIASASLNLLGEVAAAGVPLVAVPEDRPHDEQRCHTAMLAEQFDVPVATGWDAPLAPLVARALEHGPRRLSDGRGARRAADVLEKLAATGRD